MYSLDNLTVNELLDKLAEAKFPGPASDSAAAITGAMAAALLEMSCEVTLKKDTKKESLKSSMKSIKAIRKDCLVLATEDMKAYAKVIQSEKLKDTSPSEFELAMKNATDTLVSIAENCNSIMTHIEQIVSICYIKVLGDLGVSAYLAEAAARSAKQGVEANVHLLHDVQYKESVLASIYQNYHNCSELKKLTRKQRDNDSAGQNLHFAL
ncbi:formiminotetrahydrofolate cyclodeaminase [Desulfitispora alkaliphila]|uniref:cyclodeaminase/cyclohydrolase family protein n=1 Tax=Desulfitispora alkaliphila TaxID=622674 RepID=UPI003D21D925